MDEILKCFSKTISQRLEKYLVNYKNSIEEIRIRCNKEIILKINDDDIIIKYFVTREDILECLQKICENSIYSYQNQISEGFVTIKGGHRVGITGSCVIENGKVININYIYSLNFRIARQILECSKEILKYIIKKDENTIYNTLIIAPPGAGKTTILRDLIRKISSGITEMNFKAVNTGIVDERGEIAAMYKGIPQNNLGIKVDIIENVCKSIGIKMLVRSMSPQIIVADEIGNEDDVESINYAMCSGCKGIFTAHGSSYNDVLSNPILNKMKNENLFDVMIFLDSNKKGKIRDIVNLRKEKSEFDCIF